MLIVRPMEFNASGSNFIIIQSGLSLIHNVSRKIIHISEEPFKNVKSIIYSLPTHEHNHLKFGQQLLGLTLTVNL